MRQVQSNPVITDTAGTRKSVRYHRGVLIKLVNFEENVWGGTKETGCSDVKRGVHIKRVSVKRGSNI